MKRTKQRFGQDYFEIAQQNAGRRTDFYERVYAIVEKIPRGMVTTYGAIGESLGLKSSARMVGFALGSIPDNITLPAYRVINRLGELSGAHHFGGYDRMRMLLEHDGVTFKNRHVDMEKHFWSPTNIKAEEQVAD